MKALDALKKLFGIKGSDMKSEKINLKEKKEEKKVSKKSTATTKKTPTSSDKKSDEVLAKKQEQKDNSKQTKQEMKEEKLSKQPKENKKEEIVVETGSKTKPQKTEIKDEKSLRRKLMFCVREVTDNLYWVGGNDHRLALFENIHPLTKGVSYNSYLLIDGSKTVLFDTVDWSVCKEFLANIEYVLDGKKLDYLVINHLEPDHAGSIEEVLLRHPEAKVISTEKGFMFMKQFGYDVAEEKKIQVKEGDTQTFDKHTIAFVEGPMVHWPEVMLSFDTANGVLFSADAFGSFNALDGKLFNDEVNFDRDWIDEARRYYTNIVGKYGQFVQALLAKAAPLLPQIKFICPLHGPIWRNDFAYLLDKYNRWSAYIPEEKGVLIVYSTMYGNTEYAAQALASKLCQKGITNVKVCDASNTDTSWLISDTFKYSHVIIASVTYNLEIYPKIKTYLHDMKMLNVQNRTFAVLENGSWAPTAGDLISEFLDEEMKMINVLDPIVTVNSSLNKDKESDLDDMVDAIVESVNKTSIDVE